MVTLFWGWTVPLSKSWSFLLSCFSMAQAFFVGWQKWKSNWMVHRATLTHQTVSHLLSIFRFVGAGWWCAVGFHILSQQWERSQLPSSCLQLLHAKATAPGEQVGGLENCIKTCRSYSSVHHAHFMCWIKLVPLWIDTISMEKQVLYNLIIVISLSLITCRDGNMGHWRFCSLGCVQAF